MRRILIRSLTPTTLAAVAMAAAASPSSATPALVMDVTSGDVLYQNQATQPWYPASLTKLMTVYVALEAVRAHRIALDTPLVVSARAASMPPSRMAFPPGTQVTLDNALKMLMVKSANDLAVTVAEGVSGSVEAFAEDMNEAGASLGLHESHFVNPNGLPAPGHVSSARDMAIIARALYLKFPEHAGLFNIGAFSLDGAVTPNHNNLLGRYPGVDGMKTGFTCAAGFNVVASAYKDGRRLVTVIMGAPNVKARTAKAAALFDRGFAGIDRPTSSIVALPVSAGATPPDMRNEVCRNRGRLVAAFNAEVEQLDAPLTGAAQQTSLFGGPTASRPLAMATVINSIRPAPFEPVAVRVGADPGYSGLVAQARPPHSPLGTEADPAAIAYASPLAATGIAGSPLGVDANALPLRGRGRPTRAARRSKARTLRASAEAPATKVIAEEAEKSKAADKKQTAKAGQESEPAPPNRSPATKPSAKGKTAQVAPPKRPAKAKPAPGKPPVAKDKDKG